MHIGSGAGRRRGHAPGRAVRALSRLGRLLRLVNLVALASLALAGGALGAGCARHIDVIDMGETWTASGPAPSRVRIDLTSTSPLERPDAEVRLFRLGPLEDGGEVPERGAPRLIYQGRAGVGAPVEVVDLDPGRYRLELRGTPDDADEWVARDFALPEGRWLSLAYDDGSDGRAFWDGLGEVALVSAKVVGVAALVGGAVALDAAIISACCCAGGRFPRVLVTVAVVAILVD
jgi:hypothetical protein